MLGEDIKEAMEEKVQNITQQYLDEMKGLIKQKPLPQHIAIIMDGNGR